MKEFERFNPYIILFHFVFVIGCAMFVMHPVVLVTAMVSGFLYLAVLSGFKKALFTLLYALPVILITAAVNPLFNHGGASVLGYLPSGNPLTLEAVVFGGFSGIMLASVILWFSCFNILFKSDKILYVFGKLAPSISLVISMSLRFVPRFIKRAGDVIRVQNALSADNGKSTVKGRIKSASDVMTAMLGWSLENSVETAESMKCRGFGTGRRTAFSIYSFDIADGIFGAGLVLCALCLAIFGEGFAYSYYPEMFFSKDCIAQIIYGAVCFAPIIIDLWEVKRWKF